MDDKSDGPGGADPDPNQFPAGSGVAKSPTGIRGLDEITAGGLPKGRATLVCGGPGSGKTTFAMEFLVRGAEEFDEPGVVLTFQESTAELVENASALGFDLQRLMDRELLAIDHVEVDSAQLEAAGRFDLEALFIRLDHAVRCVNARRVVLDTLEMLFAGVTDRGLLRAELLRLFRWLKKHELTAVITGEIGEGRQLTRHGLEEYLSDCVISLENRIVDEISTRCMRVVKYRGSAHGTNEYPFLIEGQGISVMPLTSVGLDHETTTRRVSSGVPGLDAMLEGQGYYAGSSVLINGTPGTGKTTFAAHLAKASCERGERALYFAFEEAPQQIVRNMLSIGIDLRRFLDAGLLRFQAARPVHYGAEMHLISMYRRIEEFSPRVVIVDPISNLSASGTLQAASSVLLRLIDHLKRSGITGLFTSLTEPGQHLEQTSVNVSSLMDTWILLRDIEAGGERNRGLCVLKSRGMAHSNQIREFTFSKAGVSVSEPYVGPGGVLTGSSRLAQEARDEAEQLQHMQEVARLELDLARRREEAEAEITLLRHRWEARRGDLQQRIEQARARLENLGMNRQRMARSRGDKPHLQPAPAKDSMATEE